MGSKVQMLGQRFGKLTVIAEGGKNKHGRYLWVCRCDCGMTTGPLNGNNLRRGDTTSCGCWRRETTGKTGKSAFKHGMSGKRIAHVWSSMKARCNNPKLRNYKNYGGRGIRVCQEWNDSFESFYAYVSQLSHFGKPGYSLDRINNDGNYEPGNVRWASAETQANNRRSNKNDHQRKASASGRHPQAERTAPEGVD